ncbi:hypothetical protein X975_06210, partial [Stegodyphus mimosarum]
MSTILLAEDGHRNIPRCVQQSAAHERVRFSVLSNNRQILNWRKPSARNTPTFMHEHIRFGRGIVTVRAGIPINGRTDLYIIRNGALIAHRYRDEILRQTVVLYAAALVDEFILMEDNDRPHRAQLVDNLLFGDGIRMDWPACFPDMNPIEHV